MKRLNIIIFFLLISAYAVKSSAQDSIKRVNSNSSIFVAIEHQPEYPGGIAEFYKLIQKNLKYPEVAQLLGITGNVYVSFIIEKDGTLTNAMPVRCMGAGCESEAVRVISMSKTWSPGMQKGKQVRVTYTVPINFNYTTGIKKNKVTIKELRRSDYGFVFYIKGATYSLDEAETMLGKSFKSDDIADAEVYLNNKNYPMPEKKDVHLIVMKS